MALNKLKLPVSRLDEGQWFKVAGIDFFVRGMSQERKTKLNNIYGVKRKGAMETMDAINEFVFSDLVKGWANLTEEKLQQKSKDGVQYVVSDKLNKESEWFELEGIKFHITRITAKDVEEIRGLGNEDAKKRKTISKMILDWEGFKFDENDEDEVAFSKKVALDIFMDEDNAPALEALKKYAYNPLEFQENVSDKAINYSQKAVDDYFLNVDTNNLSAEILALAYDEDAYRQELIEKDIDLAKK